MHVPLGGARRSAHRDERKQILRSVDDKSGNHIVKRERPAVRGESAQFRRELEHRECAPVFGEIYDDAVGELWHHVAWDVDFVVCGPGEVPPGVGVVP
jgi:hypothetical protein